MYDIHFQDHHCSSGTIASMHMMSGSNCGAQFAQKETHRRHKLLKNPYVAAAVSALAKLQKTMDRPSGNPH
jgi:hypothetical protein